MPETGAEARAALTLLESLMLHLEDRGLLPREERDDVFDLALDSLRRSDPPDPDAAWLLERIKVRGNASRRDG